MTIDPRHKSRALLDGPDRAAARAMMKGAGFTDEDLARPQIGVAHCWIGTMPCNWNHRELAQRVMQGVRAAGGTPIEINTIAINDAITTGSEGMKTSLVSRELIADSVELVARGHMLEGLVTISGCDRTIPAMAMVLGRLDIPGLTAVQRLHHGRPLRRADRCLCWTRFDDPGCVRGHRRLQHRLDQT